MDRERSLDRCTARPVRVEQDCARDDRSRTTDAPDGSPWGTVPDGRLASCVPVAVLTGAIGDVTEHSVYRIASMTKSFSAAATLLLRDEGVLRLDDPIGHVRRPTRLAALTHRRRAADHRPRPARDDERPRRPTTPGPTGTSTSPTTSSTESSSKAACSREPTGVAYEYSNFGFAVLGRVVERRVGPADPGRDHRAGCSHRSA